MTASANGKSGEIGSAALGLKTDYELWSQKSSPSLMEIVTFFITKTAPPAATHKIAGERLAKIAAGE